jgi:hypothetical protein
MEHRPQRTPQKTEFVLESKKYDWYGCHEMVEDGTVIAHFYPTWHIVDQEEHKLGRLVIKGAGMDIVDFVVVTALIMIDRNEEGRRAVYCPIIIF